MIIARVHKARSSSYQHVLVLVRKISTLDPKFPELKGQCFQEYMSSNNRDKFEC